MPIVTLTRTIADVTVNVADNLRDIVRMDDLDRLDHGFTVVAVTATDFEPRWIPGLLDVTWLEYAPGYGADDAAYDREVWLDGPYGDRYHDSGSVI